jgi:hypothetical protein
MFGIPIVQSRRNNRMRHMIGGLIEAFSPVAVVKREFASHEIYFGLYG